MELDEKTAKDLKALHDSIKAALLDVIVSREQTDEQIEAVVSQMFGACVWQLLTTGEAQDKVIRRVLEDYKSRH